MPAWCSTAHSIPLSMARTSGYETHLRAAAARVAGLVGAKDWDLVWQSRSGPPQVPWLEPDICDHLQGLADTEPSRPVVVVPLGFVSDHMEVVHDLDTEAREVADRLGLTMIRAGTVGTHPRFVGALADLVESRLNGRVDVVARQAGSDDLLTPDVCRPGCCPAPVRRPTG